MTDHVEERWDLTTSGTRIGTISPGAVVLSPLCVAGNGTRIGIWIAPSGHPPTA
jgi:hypothetical protein